jgi:hypothetical protein
MSFKYDVRSRAGRKVRDVQNSMPYKSQLKQRSTIGFIPQAKINGSSVESQVDEKLPFFAMDDDYNNSQKSSYLTSDNNYHFNFEQAQNNPVFQVLNKVMVSRKHIVLDSESTSPDLHRLSSFLQSPIFGREIQKGVDKTDIKGAWLFTVFTFLLAGFDPMMSVIAATTMAYVAITPGVGGDVVRATGKASWSLLNSIRKLVSKICSTRSEYKTKISSSSPPVKELKKELAPDDTVAKFVEDVESTLKEVEDKLQQSNPVNVDVDSLARQQEEARAAELEYLLEEAKIDKEARMAEREFQLEQEKIEEDLRLAERFAEEERLAQIAEEERIADEDRLALEDEEGDNDFIDPEEWDAMIQIAEEIDSEDVDELEDWGSARKLAKDLSFVSEQRQEQEAQQQEEQEKEEQEKEGEKVADYNNPNLSDEERMELIGKAARAAVEKFESERSLESDNDMRIKETAKKAGIKGLSSNRQIPLQSNNDNSEDSSSNVDYAKMTVVQLKDILRSKGLKVSGKKAELIERLQSS